MTTTLLLNATYEPLRVIDSRRAIVLVLQEKAEVIEEGEEPFRSARAEYRRPLVIRLTRFVQVPYRARIPLSTRAVLRRDNHECGYCTKRKGTTVDHIVPRSRGGKHEWMNVIASCRPCNAKKDDKLLSEIGWELRFEPRVPHGTKWLLVGYKETNPIWATYLSPAV